MGTACVTSQCFKFFFKFGTAIELTNFSDTLYMFSRFIFSKIMLGKVFSIEMHYGVVVKVKASRSVQ